MKEILKDFPFCSRFLNYLLKSSNTTLNGLCERLSAELEVASALLENQEFLEQGREIILKFNLHHYKKIHSNQIQLIILLIYRLTVIALDSNEFDFLWREFLSLLAKKQLARRTAKYSYYTELPDKIFLAELEKELADKDQRLHLIRILCSRKKKEDPKLIEIIFQELFSIKFKAILPPEPKRLIRHKGYRDHGSLRQSKFTRPDKDVSCTTFEEDRQREIDSEREEILSFYSDIEFLNKT